MKKNIYYLGMPGSFSSIAAKKYFNDETEFVGKKSFEEIIETLQSEDGGCGIVPIENSVSGSVIPMYDLLERSPIRIIGEVYLRVKQNLLAKAPTSLDSISMVYSHPEALKQCDVFLRSLEVRRVEVSDTATAAHVVSSSAQNHEAAIASLEAADRYGLHVIAEGIETNKQNYSRFLILCNMDATAEASKCDKATIVFTLEHQPGTLLNVLSALKDHGINLTKIESRPMIGSPFEYLFYVDFEYDNEWMVPAVLELIKKQTITCKVLGMYPKGVFHDE